MLRTKGKGVCCDERNGIFVDHFSGDATHGKGLVQDETRQIQEKDSALHHIEIAINQWKSSTVNKKVIWRIEQVGRTTQNTCRFDD